MLVLSLALFLTGCATPDVKYSDLQPATTATVSNGVVTVHLGSDLTASACWTRVRLRAEGSRVYLAGNRTLQEQSRKISIRVSPSVDANSVQVIWVNPDGTRVPVPVTNKP